MTLKNNNLVLRSTAGQDTRVDRPCSGERGAAMVEYALLIALIAIVTLGGAATFGGGVFAEYNDINSTIEVELDPNAN